MLKLLVPTGYMIDDSHGRIVVTICSGTGPATITMDMPGMDPSMPDHGEKDHGKAEMPCAFSGLAAAALGAIDPVQLAALIALPMRSSATWLRPPLRGPPTYA